MLDPNLDSGPFVIDIRRIPNGGKLVALADVEVETTLGSVTFVDCAVFRSEEGVISVGAPSKPNSFPGRAKYLPMVRWHPDLQQAITEAVTQTFEDPDGFEAEPAPTFRQEMRQKANLPAERPGAGYRDTGRGGGYQGNRYGNSGGGSNSGRNGGQR